MNIKEVMASLQEEALLYPKHSFSRNDLLCIAGTINTNIYFIESGTVQILFSHDDEVDQVVRFGYGGNLIVCLDSVLNNQASAYSIQAIKKVSVRIIPKPAFENWLQSEISNQQFWTRLLEDLILQQLQREQDLLISSPQIRYQRVLERSPRLFQEVPLKYIANYLRMSPETLSRLRSKP